MLKSVFQFSSWNSECSNCNGYFAPFRGWIFYGDENFLTYNIVIAFCEFFLLFCFQKTFAYKFGWFGSEKKASFPPLPHFLCTEPWKDFQLICLQKTFLNLRFLAKKSSKIALPSWLTVLSFQLLCAEQLYASLSLYTPLSPAILSPLFWCCHKKFPREFLSRSSFVCQNEFSEEFLSF